MKSISFVRWGNLNPVKHKEHSKKEDFHVAPKKKGIYAFPCGYVERFLIWDKTWKSTHSSEVFIEKL